MSDTQTKMISYDHKFTDTERDMLKNELVKMLNDKTGIQDEKKSTAAAYKSQLDELGKDIAHTILCINTGSETRHVTCERSVDLDNNVVNWMDVESGEIRREELPTADDRQMEITVELTRFVTINPDDEFVQMIQDIQLDDGDEPFIPKGAVCRIVEKAKPGKNQVATFSHINSDDEQCNDVFTCQKRFTKTLDPWDAEKLLEKAGFEINKPGPSD